MARNRSKNRPNHTGRNPVDRFARLSHRLLNSNAYRSLSPNDRALLLELTMMENCSNNGSLFLSLRDAADRVGLVDVKTVGRSFDTLQNMGFIEMTQDAHSRVKAAEYSRARCWRLTWLTGPGRRAASMRFMDREPEPGTRGHKRMLRGQIVLKAYRKTKETGRLPVVDSDTMASDDAQTQVQAVADFTTQIPENGGNLPKWLVAKSSAHTAATMGRETQSHPVSWWHPDWTPRIANLTYAAILASNHRSIAA